MKLSNIKEVQQIQRMAAEINEGISNYTRCKKDEHNGTIEITATAKNGHQRTVAANKEKAQVTSLALDETELELLDWIVMRAKARHEAELNTQLGSLGVDSKINLLTGEIEDVCDD